MLSEMSSVILDKPAKRKLQIMNFLFNETIDSISLTLLCEKFDYTYPTIQTLTNELQHDFEAIGFFDFCIEKGKIIWCPERYPWRTYQQFLIRQSIPYRWLKATLLFPEKKVVAFCQENFVSRTTLARKMKPLSIFLATFDIRLSLTKMQLLSKNEASIRIIYINYLWLGSFGEELTQKNELASKEQQILEREQLTHLNFIHPKEVNLFFVVARLRATAGFYLREAPFKKLILPDSISTLSNYVCSFINDPTQVERHVEFLGFLIYYYPYFVDEADERIPFIYKYFQSISQTAHPFTELVYELLNYMTERSKLRSLNQREDRLLKMNLFKTFLNFSVFKETPFPSVDLTLSNVLQDSTEKNLLADEIESFLKKVCRRKNFDWLKNQRRKIAYTLATTIFPFYSTQQTPVSINVTVVPIPDYLAMKEIKDYLENLKFVNYSPFSTDLKEIDVCIASSEKLLTDFSAPASFIIPFEHSDFYKSRLFDHLLAVHTKKKFS